MQRSVALIWSGKASVCPGGKATCMAAHLLTPLLEIIQNLLGEEIVCLCSVVKKDLLTIQLKKLNLVRYAREEIFAECKYKYC